MEPACDIIHARIVVDASKRPWSAIGRIVDVENDIKGSHCTGTLIGDRTVLTASHCLYDSSAGRWFRPGRIRFEAGYHNTRAAASSKVFSYRVGRKLDDSAEDRSAGDWAVLKLAEPIGIKTGYLEWRPIGAVDLKSRIYGNLFVAGYPRLAPHALHIDVRCHADRSEGSYLFFDNCAMVGGDSGGPLLYVSEFKLHVIGVNVAAVNRIGAAGGIAILVEAIDIR